MPIIASASADERLLVDVLRGMKDDTTEIEYLPGEHVTLGRISEAWFVVWNNRWWMQPLRTVGDVRRLMTKTAEGVPDGTTITLVVQDGRWHFAHTATDPAPCGPPLMGLDQATAHFREGNAD